MIISDLQQAVKKNIITYPEMSMILAKRHSFSHDISHCNPKNTEPRCHYCKRYIAHVQLKDENNAELYCNGLYSYLSEPQVSCLDKDYKMFVPL